MLSCKQDIISSPERAGVTPYFFVMGASCGHASKTCTAPVAVIMVRLTVPLSISLLSGKVHADRSILTTTKSLDGEQFILLAFLRAGMNRPWFRCSNF